MEGLALLPYKRGNAAEFLLGKTLQHHSRLQVYLAFVCGTDGENTATSQCAKQ
jgi:hypothetical protein